MRLNPQDLKKNADLTLEHYNRRAEDFWEGTPMRIEFRTGRNPYAGKAKKKRR